MSEIEEPDQDREAIDTGGEDPLTEIDEIVGHWSDLRQESLSEQARAEIEHMRFQQEFRDVTGSVIRPTMEKAIERLRKDGGGGLIEEHDVDILHKPRIVLWMSLEGEITGTPREDRNPFLRLDSDVVHRCIDVWEGDMVGGQGTSRAAAPLAISDVTSARVMGRIIDVLRRAGTHGVAQ